MWRWEGGGIWREEAKKGEMEREVVGNGGEDKDSYGKGERQE
jgi:hypothetical protein